MPEIPAVLLTPWVPVKELACHLGMTPLSLSRLTERIAPHARVRQKIHARQLLAVLCMRRYGATVRVVEGNEDSGVVEVRTDRHGGMGLGKVAWKYGWLGWDARMGLAVSPSPAGLAPDLVLLAALTGLVAPKRAPAGTMGVPPRTYGGPPEVWP